MALITIGNRKINPSKVSYIEGKNVVSRHGYLVCDDEDTLEEIKTAMEEGSSGFKGLCFTAVQANSSVKMNIGKEGCIYATSTDGKNWEDYTLGTTITLANIGDKVYFKGNGMKNATSNPIFVMTGKIAGSGSVMSLIDGVGESLDMTGNSFRSMFYNNKSITTPPNLPATKLSSQCYYYMFYECSSLFKTPDLPAETLESYCYGYMFVNCTSITKSPYLPASPNKASCYVQMFKGCSNLNLVKVGATEWANNTGNWLFGVSSTGLFIKPENLSIQIGANGIPEGWSIENF